MKVSLRKAVGRRRGRRKDIESHIRIHAGRRAMSRLLQSFIPSRMTSLIPLVQISLTFSTLMARVNQKTT